MKSYKLYINGMHCSSCAELIEDKLNDLPEVSSIKVSFNNRSVDIVGDFQEEKAENIAQKINKILKSYGYSVSAERQKHLIKWSEFYIAIPVAGTFIALFFILQNLGVVNLISASNVNYATAFIVGLVASISTCIAVVGALVLSVSANFAKEGDRIKPQLLFHIGRLVSFFILGGIIGSLGLAFQLSGTGTFILSFIVAIVLLVLGINLLDIFSFTKKFKITTPKFFGKHISSLNKLNHSLTPLLLGVATFFLPCGFTQSMQIYTLKTGSFLTGGLTMFVFALGTLPVLSLLSFSSSGINSKMQSGIFFKTSGLIVILFAIFNLINALAVGGIVSPVF